MSILFSVTHVLSIINVSIKTINLSNFVIN